MTVGPILVAGQSGQLARCLVESAAQREMRLIALGRPEFDIEDARVVEHTVRTVEPSAIVNTAAYTAVDRAEREPDRALAVNYYGAERLAIEAQRFGAPFIHISTDYVFDGRKSGRYTEDDAPLPLNVYGHSKLKGEEAVRNACPSAFVLRTSWIYSPYAHNFLTTMLRLAEKREDIRVVDDQWGSPTSGSDLANAILDILTQLGRRDFTSRAGVYHLTAQGEATWYSFASAIFANWAARGRLVTRLIPISGTKQFSAASRPANSRLDCGKIERQFGIRLPPWMQSLDICLERLLARSEV
jgi:dTDP-4-dehydrorhamnose reductase